MAVAVTIVAAMIEIITSYPHREPPSRRVAKDGRMKEKENADRRPSVASAGAKDRAE